MPDLEPITRDEKLWSGEDLEPITRREMYIKHLYDETQVIPDKPITREEMFILKAGEELHDVTIEQLTATENRTYSEEGVAYSPVIVNVPQTTLTTLDVTENGTYTAPSGTAYDEVEVDVPLPDNAYLLKEIENVEIATFTDGSDLPMPKLEVAVEPQQDLHGYDAPWVGGAGKNKCGEFELGTLSESSAQGSTYDNMKVSNTARMRSKTLIEIPSTCTISCANGYQYAFAGYDANMEYLGVYQFYTWRSEAYTFNNSTIKYIAIIIKRTDEGNIQSNDYTNSHIQLESGNQATSYAPYSNICPISGWSAVDVNVVGKNKLNLNTNVTVLSGSVPSAVNITSSEGTATITENYYDRTANKFGWAFDVKANQIYSLSFIADSTDTIAIKIYDSNGDVVFNTTASATGTVSRQFTPTESGTLYFYVSISTWGQTINITKAQIEEGSTATEYTPYNPNSETITIQLGDTYYGGKLDVVSGVLTVDRAYVDMGDLNYIYEDASTPKVFRATLSPTPKLSGVVICSSYKGTQKGAGALDNNELCISGTQAYPFLRIRDDAYTDATAFKTAVNGQKLVYELATPQTIQLTPTQVSSLMGVNNIWADCGKIIDGQYFSKEV